MGEKKRHLATETVEAQPPSKKPREGEDPETVLAELRAELGKEKAKSEDYLRRLQYLQADFENYRKRVEKEMSDNRQFGNQRLLSDLLVVNDELELALREAEESKENPTIVEGVEMVHKRLQSILSKEGVAKIPSLGSKFNPDLHDAALRVLSDKEEGTIMEEIRQGYTLKGKVLRPSIVKVAENSAERESKSEKSPLEEVGDHE
ncbi:MAG TPA: nucleotide exchange factor GrpE [Candidatus Bathyarchaeia archaeon]|nr:nucleotide exchange factor GrpE [Candidatus Bathyarchaeia archaeon]